MKMLKKIFTAMLPVGLLVVTGFIVQSTFRGSRGSGNVQPVLPIAVSRVATPADQRIKLAQQSIEKSPSKVDGYNLLASAFMQKARETSDFSFNTRAEGALGRALEIDPANYDTIKLRAKLLLSYHRFTEALNEARRAQTMRPDDHDNYGAITDALVELGDYPAAIESAQKMVDRRPDSASYARVSYLRSLHGDGVGAVAAMRVAVQAANPNDPEGAAWCRVHLGDELMNVGRKQEAGREYDNALVIFPGYPLALAAKARAYVGDGELQKAAELYERAQNRVPLPDIAIALGDLYAKLGRVEEAKRQYELVNFVERDGSASGTYSRQLALFWADHDQKLAEALAIVERERAIRRDIYTCDALAWIQFKNKRIEEAKTSINEAMRLNTRDARLYYHAGMIYKAVGDRGKAKQFLAKALEINQFLDVLQSDAARQALQEIRLARRR
jgi:tetratricopeptide (TPR) repeat protein